ncbi:MAG: alpha-ketoglutarate-dependent dioxygenase AlkB [Deltaproteobacteria bacterium]|nr:alpha-ketoglutarate-dependent dioxygenase AlkB [Deltaproteobacteria bacterium]
MGSAQQSLFGHEPVVTFERDLSRVAREHLDETAWIDHVPGWVKGHETLFAALAAGTAWHEQQRQMYERVVDVPRLVASLPKDGPGHEALPRLRDALEDRYGVAFPFITMALYAHGDHSVAWHGDYVARELQDAVVATVSLGEPRRFLLRPKGGGKSRSMMLGWGDLLVMGGTCQRTWEHAIPKVAHAAGPRIAVMFRPKWYEAAQRWHNKADDPSALGTGMATMGHK